MSEDQVVARCDSGRRGPRSSATHAEIGDRHLRELFAADPGRGERLGAEAAGCTSTTRRTASPTKPCGCCSSSPRSPISRRAAT